MATTFDSLFASLGFPVLLTQFGESLTYHPLTGDSREITGIVNRAPPTQYGPNDQVIKPMFTVRVHNDSTLGISSAELNDGGDEMALYERIGDAATVRVKIRVLNSQDSGVLNLALV